MGLAYNAKIAGMNRFRASIFAVMQSTFAFLFTFCRASSLLLLLFFFFVNVGLRVYDKNIRSTDATESAAFSYRTEVIDIYSNSWGPGDLGWQVQGPGVLGSKAIEHGIKKVSF